MIKNYPAVSEAHEADDLLFGTVDSWVLYVRLLSLTLTPLQCLSIRLTDVVLSFISFHHIQIRLSPAVSSQVSTLSTSPMLPVLSS